MNKFTFLAAAALLLFSCTGELDPGGHQDVVATAIILNRSELSLEKGASETLTVSFTPSNVTDKTLTWVSSNPSVATVVEGVVTGVDDGFAEIVVKNGEITAKCKVTVNVTMEAVDMGLSVKWSNVNVGAKSPKEDGFYYAWGETAEKDYYAWFAYKYGDLSAFRWLNAYCPSGKKEYWYGDGTPDNKTVLDAADDAAHVKLGGNWRMPTDEEWTELRTNCTWTWVDGEKKGYKIVGQNGNSIFLPADGYRHGAERSKGSGCYWSSSLDKDSPGKAWCVYFDSGSVDRLNDSRCKGFSIRPVVKINSAESVDLGLSVYWAKENLVLEKVQDRGDNGDYDYLAWGEVKKYYRIVNIKEKGVILLWESGKGEGYDWSSYKWARGTHKIVTKYCPLSKNEYWSADGTPDGKTVLDAEDDAAHVKLGGNWRMPTAEEWTELATKCTWTWVTDYKGTGISGRLVTAQNGNSIFLPASGFKLNSESRSYYLDSGFYWSSSLSVNYPGSASYMCFNSVDVNRYQFYYRSAGFPVRPVTE